MGKLRAVRRGLLDDRGGHDLVLRPVLLGFTVGSSHPGGRWRTGEDGYDRYTLTAPVTFAVDAEELFRRAQPYVGTLTVKKGSREPAGPTFWAYRPNPFQGSPRALGADHRPGRRWQVRPHHRRAANGRSPPSGPCTCGCAPSSAASANVFRAELQDADRDRRAASAVEREDAAEGRWHRRARAQRRRETNPDVLEVMLHRRATRSSWRLRSRHSGVQRPRRVAARRPRRSQPRLLH